MKLYHGGIAVVEQPQILDTQRLLDFGKGFYTTTNMGQAERWAIIKQKRLGETAKSLVSEYEFDDFLLADQTLNVMLFKQASEEWLDFVVQNRNENVNHGYDMVIGPVANDTLYQTFTLYEAGILTKPETISRLKVHPLFDQVSFHSPKALVHLKFIDSYLVIKK
jgi:hypothetical protein